MEYYFLMILVLIVATGYIQSIKNNRPSAKVCGYFLITT